MEDAEEAKMYLSLSSSSGGGNTSTVGNNDVDDNEMTGCGDGNGIIDPIERW